MLHGRSFSHASRVAHIQRLEVLTGSIARSLQEHGEVGTATAYAAFRDQVSALLLGGFDRAGLTTLPRRFPPAPSWMDPGTPEYEWPRGEWREEIARTHGEARALTLDLAEPDRAARVAMVASVALTTGAAAVALVHAVSSSVTIDTTTLALLGIAALPWLSFILTSISLPGGFKADFRELSDNFDQFSEQSLEQLTQVKNKIDSVERKIVGSFEGGTAAQQGRIEKALEDFDAYLTAVGAVSDHHIPKVNLEHGFPDQPAAYDLSAGKLYLDRRLADEPGLALHEYCHRVLRLSAASAATDSDLQLEKIHYGLAGYLVCSYLHRPTWFIDRDLEREMGYDSRPIDHDDTVSALGPDPHPSWIGYIWAQAFWQLRLRRIDGLDAVLLKAWRRTFAAGVPDESAFVVAFLDGLASACSDQVAEEFRASLLRKGLLPPKSAPPK